MAVSFTPTTVSNPTGAQGTYPLTQTIGQEGALADLQAYVTRSYRNQSGAVIPFGILVMTDNSPSTNDVFAVEPATGATGIVGLALEAKIFEGALGGIYDTGAKAADGRLGYPAGQTVTVMSKGVAWVYTTEAVALGDAVRFWDTANDPTVAGAHLGRFCKTASTTKTTAITTGARWLSETTGAGLALLEIDLPAATFTADT